jgi:phenylacetate-CoA ligase
MKFATDKLNYMTAEQIKEYQEEKLRAQIAYCYNNSEYYRQKFTEVGALPEDIKTIEDFRKLPIMMTKESERDSQQESLEKYGHPFGMHLCCRPEELTVTSTTSGTTGVPTFTYTFSKRDIFGPLAQNWGHMFKYGGVQVGQRILFCYALGVYATSQILWGIRHIGALPIDVDVRGGTEPILQFADLTKPFAGCFTPSLAEHLVVRAPDIIGKEMGELGLKALFLTGEPGLAIPEIKKRIEDAYGCRIYDYMAQGAGSFGISCDSDEYHGMHCYAPDYNLYQDDLVDPDTKEPIDVVDGAIGEAVHTSLDRDAVPSLRYAYGDIMQVFTTECPACGFKGKRVVVIGRTDDLLIIKGANVYPIGIKDVLTGFMPKVTGEMRIILDKRPPRVDPPLKIRIEYGQGVDKNQLPDLEKQIKHQMHTRQRFTPEIIWESPGTFEKSMRKTPVFEKTYE